MSSRQMVISKVGAMMQEAFAKGHIVDAQNMNAFIVSLEGMTDIGYEMMVDEEEALDREQIGLG